MSMQAVAEGDDKKVQVYSDAEISFKDALANAVKKLNAQGNYRTISLDPAL